MDRGYKMLGFAVIAILYCVIGIMAAKGTIGIFRKMFAPKSELKIYAIFLIAVATLYLAFAAYFEATRAWPLEMVVVAGFFALALLGMRLPFALVGGFCLHGLWDLLHELQAHGIYSAFQPGQMTAIPLAYGTFCAAFDFYLAGHLYARRFEWRTATSK